MLIYLLKTFLIATHDTIPCNDNSQKRQNSHCKTQTVQWLGRTTLPCLPRCCCMSSEHCAATQLCKNMQFVLSCFVMQQCLVPLFLKL
jgi:hypothetical protein